MEVGVIHVVIQLGESGDRKGSPDEKSDHVQKVLEQ